MREAIEIMARLTFDVDAARSIEDQTESCIADIERLRDADSTTGAEFTSVQILDQLSEHDAARLSPTTIVVHAPKPDPTRLFADNAQDSDGNSCACFNRYHCADCQEHWVMQWSCACNDRCPTCNQETQAHRSDHLVHSDQTTGLTYQLRILCALISACEMLAGEMGQDDFQSGIAETGLDAVLTARGAVDPLEVPDLNAIIGDLHRQLSLKRSKWALGQGGHGLVEDPSKPPAPNLETVHPTSESGV